MKTSIFANAKLAGRTLVLPAALYLVAVSAAHAQLINIDFNRSSPPSPTVTGAGVIGGSGDTWNYIGSDDGSGNGTLNLSIGSLVDSTGNGTPESVTGSGFKSYHSYGPNWSPAPAGAASASSWSYMYTTPSVSGTLTLSGLSDVYDVYVLDSAFEASGNDGTRSGDVTIGSTTLTLDDGHSTQSTWVAGTNYIEFTNVSPNSDGEINLSFATTSGDGEADFTGIQLLDVSSSSSVVPEPSTYALMLAGLTLLGFVSRARSRRSV